MGEPASIFVDRIDDNLLCSVCGNVLQDAVVTSCGHTFCLLCLSTWLSPTGERIINQDLVTRGTISSLEEQPMNTQSSNSSCPECRSSITSSTFHPIHSLRNFILSLFVYCPYYNDGCPVVMPLEQRASHKERCLFATVRCPGCNISIKRQHLNNHLDRCGFNQQQNDITGNEDGNQYQHLLVKVNELSLQVQQLKNDLIEAKRHNGKLTSELQQAQREINLKQKHLQQIQNIYFDPEYGYGYSTGSIARLSALIARFLSKPSYIDSNRLFHCVKRCYDNYGRCGTAYEDDVTMLLATVNASSWFTASQKQYVRVWLASQATYKQYVAEASGIKKQKP